MDSIKNIEYVLTSRFWSIRYEIENSDGKLEKKSCTIDNYGAEYNYQLPKIGYCIRITYVNSFIDTFRVVDLLKKLDPFYLFHPQTHLTEHDIFSAQYGVTLELINNEGIHVNLIPLLMWVNKLHKIGHYVNNITNRNVLFGKRGVLLSRYTKLIEINTFVISENFKKIFPSHKTLALCPLFLPPEVYYQNLNIECYNKCIDQINKKFNFYLPHIDNNTLRAMGPITKQVIMGVDIWSLGILLLQNGVTNPILTRCFAPVAKDRITVEELLNTLCNL